MLGVYWLAGEGSRLISDYTPPFGYKDHLNSLHSLASKFAAGSGGTGSYSLDPELSHINHFVEANSSRIRLESVEPHTFGEDRVVARELPLNQQFWNALEKAGKRVVREGVLKREKESSSNNPETDDRVKVGTKEEDTKKQGFEGIVGLKGAVGATVVAPVEKNRKQKNTEGDIKLIPHTVGSESKG